MKLKFDLLLAWIIASVVLMYTGILVRFMGSFIGEYILLASVVMLPCTFVLAEYAED